MACHFECLRALLLITCETIKHRFQSATAMGFPFLLEKLRTRCDFSLSLVLVGTANYN